MKTTTQLISDMRHELSLLEAANNGVGGKRQSDNVKAVEKENAGLRAKISAINRSNGQYKGMYERKNKETLRLQSKISKLSELVSSLTEEINLQRPIVDSFDTNIYAVPQA